MKTNTATPKNIWMLTREYGDLAGAGGVKDVTAQLSRAMAAWSGRKVNVVVPLYGFMNPSEHGFAIMMDPQQPEKELYFEVTMNYVSQERREGLRVWWAKIDRVNLYLLESPRFAEKGDVYTYTAEEETADPSKRQGEGHFDFFAMNMLLQKGALQLMLNLQEKPDIIHCHDGHTAVLPAIISETPWLKSYFRATSCLVTIHNAGVGYHQDVADLPFAHAMTELPWRVIMQSRLLGNFDPLVCAGLYAAVNTVSENYARELQESLGDEQTGWLGHHLGDLGVVLEGITNGVDPDEFSPLKGSSLGLAASFDPRKPGTLEGKEQCKRQLIETLSQHNAQSELVQHGYLEQGTDVPLFSFIGRLSEQKGIDILLGAMEKILDQFSDIQLVILGRGAAAIENSILSLVEEERNRGRVCFLSGYHTGFAFRVYSGGDFFLVPSRYEPCGLTDFIAQLFGNLPIVHHVGGLVKVINEKTGFSYVEHSPDALAEAIVRAIAAYENKTLMQTMLKSAAELIDRKYTWKEVKNQYLQLYKKTMVNSFQAH